MEVMVRSASCPLGRVVGVKLVDKYKSRVKIGDVVTIEHQGILSGGGLRHPVYIPKERGGVL